MRISYPEGVLVALKIQRTSSELHPSLRALHAVKRLFDLQIILSPLILQKQVQPAVNVDRTESYRCVFDAFL